MNALNIGHCTHLAVETMWKRAFKNEKKEKVLQVRKMRCQTAKKKKKK